jgi:hypothetical protein
MKHQYFGDINDYRKYGLLRILANSGSNRIGVCWMLTPDDGSRDGGDRKLTYLKKKNVDQWQKFDKALYQLIRETIWDHRRDKVKNQYRSVDYFFKQKFVPKSSVWDEELADCPIERPRFIERMFREFDRKGVKLVFFDPDNGLAGAVGHLSIRKGASTSCKHLFCDEVNACISRGFSALVYQHFRQQSSIKVRKALIRDVLKELRTFTAAQRLACFTTPDVFYVLVPTKMHEQQLLAAAENVATSQWATLTGTTKSKITQRKQIKVFCDSE